MTTQKIIETRQNLMYSVKDSCCKASYLVAALTEALSVIEEETGETDRMISNETDIVLQAYTSLINAYNLLRGV